MSDFGEIQLGGVVKASRSFFQYPKQNKKMGISLRYEKSPLLKVKSSWFWAALQIPSFLRDFELATILQ